MRVISQDRLEDIPYDPYIFRVQEYEGKWYVFVGGVGNAADCVMIIAAEYSTKENARMAIRLLTSAYYWERREVFIFPSDDMVRQHVKDEKQWEEARKNDPLSSDYIGKGEKQ